MNNNILKLILLLFPIISYSSKTCGQNRYYVEKNSCAFHQLKGYKLILHHRAGKNDTSSLFFGYDLQEFIGISDSCKLIIIKELLQFENDTSVCCLEMAGYNFGNEGWHVGEEKPPRYKIQIDALFMINRMVWPKLTVLYSCYPSMYDTLEKVNITNDSDKIKLVYQEYRTWYEDCISKGRIPRYFPFNDGRFVWSGGQRSIVEKGR